MRRSIKISHRKLSLGGGLAAIAMMAAPGKASAQAQDRWVELGQIDGIASVRDLGDGRVEVMLDDGRLVILEEGQFAISGDTVFVLESSVEAILAVEAAGVPTALILGGLAVLAGGAAVAAGGGGSDGPSEPADAAPRIGSAASASVAENDTAVLTVSATDPEGASVSYAISGGADASLFEIDSATGELRFVAAPDFEVASDADGDNVYDVIVSASDGVNTVTQVITVTVTNENDNDPIFQSGATGTVDEGATATDYKASASDADGDTIAYSIEGGADASLFTINATTGALTLVAAQDAENPGDADGDGVYEVVIGASDGSTTVTQAVTITLGDVDEDPVFASGATGSFDENQLTTDYVADADDPEGASVTYSLGTSGDSALFAIDAATGVLSVRNAQNFEFPGDVDADGDYEVEVVATDATGKATSRMVTLTLGDVNEAPTLTLEQLLVDENQSSAGVAQGDDPDGDTLTYAITGGADASAFTIDSATGELTFVTAPDFEAPADANGDNVYIVDVRVSDPDGLTSTAQIAVIVGDANDNAPVITSGATASFDENGLGVALDVDATDADASSTITYSIAGGADAADFVIDPATGELTFASAPDFENPDDADGDNVYEVTVSASDGENVVTQDVDITVNDRINEYPPVITSASTFSVDEDETGGQVVGTVTASDQDPTNGGISYAITGGADAAFFSIDPATGILSFASGTDFEAMADADGDNVYDVIVTATDQPSAGTPRSTDQAIAVTLTNVDDEPPQIANFGSGTATENDTATDYVAQAFNDDGDQSTIRYFIGGGQDQTLFTVDPITGALSFISAPDFENPTDQNGDNEYIVTVSAEDASGFNRSQNLIITVTDENDQAPAITSPTTASIDENETSTGYTPTATDGDTTGETIAFSIGTARDSALFEIDPASGNLVFASAPNFENPQDDDGDNDYVVELIASDGVNQSSQLVTVTVNDMNDVAPAVTSGSTATVAENDAATFYTVTATDADSVGGPLTYAITGGADAALFEIDSATGELSFISGADFETPADADGDNVYEVEVAANDGVNTGASQAVSVTVTDVEPETILLSQMGSDGYIIDTGFASGLLYITGLGDYDGDGIGDLLVGDPGAATSGFNNGVVGVTLGDTGPKGASNGNYFLYDASSDMSLTSGNDDRLGSWNFWNLGDINNDGVTDFALTRDDPIGGSSSDVYVWLDGYDNLPTTITDIETFFGTLGFGEGFVIRDAYIETAGVDFDGNGVDDLIVDVAGQSKLFFNSGGAFPLTFIGAGQPWEYDTSGGVTIGSVVDKTNLGDIDGDGMDDIVVQTGTDAFFWYGQSQATVPSALTAANSDRQFSNLPQGVFVALGDINADGYDDFAVIDTDIGVAGQPGGGIYVYLGGTSRNNRTAADADFTILPAGNEKVFSAHAIGDVNGDGYDDFAVLYEGANAQEMGIVFGGTSFVSITPVDVLPVRWDAAGTVGVTDGWYQPLGDVNGDGIDDFYGYLTGVAGGGDGFVRFGEAADQVAVSLVDTTAGRDVLVGTSQDDLLVSANGGEDLLIGGGGNDRLELRDIDNAQALELEGDAGIDSVAIGSTDIINLTGASQTFFSNNYARGVISFDGVERLTLGDSTGTSATVMVGLETLVYLGEYINGTRTLIVDYDVAGSTLILDDAPDWSAAGQTTYDGTTYNVFVYTNGWELWTEAGNGNNVIDFSGNDLKDPATQQVIAKEPLAIEEGVDVFDALLDAKPWLFDGFAPELAATPASALQEIREVMADVAMIDVGSAVLPVGSATTMGAPVTPLAEPGLAPDIVDFTHTPMFDDA